MVLVDRRQRESASWSELLPKLPMDDDSLEQRFADAVAAIESARREGRLTGEQSDTLLRYISAAMIEAKLNMIVNHTITQSLNTLGFGNRRSWGHPLPSLAW